MGLEVNLQAAAQERGVDHHSPHLAALVDSMEVAGWIKQDLGADSLGRCDVGMSVRRITKQGTEMLHEVIG